MEKKCKKAKWLSGEVLQIAVKRREAKKQRRKGKIYPFKIKIRFEKYFFLNSFMPIVSGIFFSAFIKSF